MNHAELRDYRQVEHTPDHVDALPAGTRLAEYELQGLLGMGGFGMVYRAYDHHLQRSVAIKEYMPNSLACRQGGLAVVVRSANDAQTYASGLESFIAEARLLARLDHPSLVRVHRFWEANGTAYLVMPLYRGVTMKQARGLVDAPPPEAWLRRVLQGVLPALQLLHEQNILHRDISPENILLQDVGPPVLLDLGSARQALGESGKRDTAVLKVNYAPIEQYAQAAELREGPWTDLYALAAVIYGFVRNEPPQPATFRLVRDRMPSMASVARTVRQHFGRAYSREFTAAIDHALRIQPGSRPQSVAGFMKKLGLQSDSPLREFDWWREVEDDEFARASGRRRGFWSFLGAGVGDGRQGWTTIVPWAQTGDRETIWQDFDRSTGDLNSRVSTFDVPQRAAAVPRRRSWSRNVLRVPAVLVAAVGEGAAVVADFLGRVLEWMARSAALWLGAGVLSVLLAIVLLFKGTSQPTTTSSPERGAGRVGAPVAQLPPVDATKPVLSAPAEVAPVAAESEPPAAAPVVAPKPAPRPVVRKPAARQTPPVARPAHKSAPAPKPAPVAASGANLCADANFFTRPMCLHTECQKPQNAKLQICVETRKREAASRPTNY